jgi:hypothetical protein
MKIETVDDLAQRLGINQAELEVLKAQEAARSLPGYIKLRDYLTTQLLQRQKEEWNEAEGKLLRKRAAIKTFEVMDEFQAKFRQFVDSL